MTSSARVRGLCTPSAYCGPTVLRRQLCSRCSVWSSSLSLLTPLRRGGALRPPPTDSVSILAVLRRAVRSDLWTSSGKSDTHTFEDLCNSADDELFTKIRTSSNHILHALLPPPSQNYGLRQRVHSLQLPERSTHLSDCNFLMRMLYKNSY